MDSSKWGVTLTVARQRLLDSRDFNALRGCGHQLTDGVVLTSVSDVPFEMSFKCAGCGATFWFENVAWSTGGAARWHISSLSREQAGGSCPVSRTLSARSEMLSGFGEQGRGNDLCAIWYTSPGETRRD